MRSIAEYEGLRRPWVRALAVVSVLFAGWMLIGSVKRHRAVKELPPGAAQPAGEGYQGLLNPEQGLRPSQTVVVAAGPVQAGDRFEAASLAEQDANLVVEMYPSARNPESLRDPLAPLVVGCFARPAEAIGRYAAVDLAEGTPLSANNTSTESVRANPLDAQRPDRFTIALAAEPTLFELLKVGDRVDVYFISPDQVSRRTLLDVRVVAINREQAADEQDFSEAMRREQRSVRAWAARRKRDMLLASRGKTPDTPEPGETEATRAKQRAERLAAEAKKKAEEVAESGKAGDQKTAETKTTPQPSETPAAIAKSEYDGRSITLQVNRLEAHLLSAAVRTPHLTIDVALRARS